MRELSGVLYAKHIQTWVVVFRRQGDPPLALFRAFHASEKSLFFRLCVSALGWGHKRLLGSVSRAMRAAATKFAKFLRRDIHLGLGCKHTAAGLRYRCKLVCGSWLVRWRGRVRRRNMRNARPETRGWLLNAPVVVIITPRSRRSVPRRPHRHHSPSDEFVN